MVRLSAAVVALLVGVSNILGVVAEVDVEVESVTTTAEDLDGKVVIGFPAVNLTALFVEAEQELGVNGTISNTLPPEAGEPATGARLTRRHLNHMENLRKRFLSSITGPIVCGALKLVFWDKVALQGSTNYASWNNPSFWSQRTYMEPACVFRPTEPEEISLAVRVFGLGQNDFGVVGGGHSAIKGWGNAEDGVLVILAGLKGIDFKTGSAVVSTGERWGNVFTEMDKKGVMSLGGRMGSVGVPGLTLGGGISYLSNQYGFVCDQVKSFEIVLSDGRIVIASSSLNSDLFRALKGGSNNFGIVTKIELYTWASTEVYSGQLTYTDPTDFPKLIKAVYNYHTVGALSDVTTHLISAFVYIGAYRMHLGAFTAFRNTNTGDLGPSLKEVIEINPTVTSQSTIKRRKYGTQAVELGSGNVNGLRQDSRVWSVYADLEYYQQAYNIWATEMAKYGDLSGFMGTIAFQPITTKAVAAGVARGGNSLGLEKNTKTMAIINLTHQWASSSDDTAILGGIKKVFDQCVALAKSKGIYHQYSYLNYALGDVDVIKNYGTESVERLKAARRKYDESSMFREQVPGGFKIPS